MLQEIVMRDRIYVSGKVRDVVAFLKEYEQNYKTVVELINSKIH